MPLQWRNQIWQSLEEGAEIRDARRVGHAFRRNISASLAETTETDKTRGDRLRRRQLAVRSSFLSLAVNHKMQELLCFDNRGFHTELL